VELGEAGYAGFSLEAVARRSGVHKTTVYRRWPTRESLIADALNSRTDRNMPVIDTGSLRGDLRAFGEYVRGRLSSQYGKAMMKALVVGVDESPEVLETVKVFWRDRLDAGAALVAQGMKRGELPQDIDADHLVESLLAPIYLRVLFSIPHEREDFLAEHIELLLGGVSREGASRVMENSKPD
jgi:AcrR family transcriptional regulator